jgi:xanthine dehydrogenase accessory factor
MAYRKPVQEALLRALGELLASGGRGALATVVRSTGSTPQRPGARMLLCDDGSVLGTVGGGAIENAVLERLRALKTLGGSEMMVKELGFDLGMCCGGRMEIFIESIEARPTLWLCGAGHVNCALAPLVSTLGFDIAVLDAREELNNAARFPGARRELLDGDELLKRAPLSNRDWLLIATHDHALDERILERALSGQPRYVGLVGSRRKVFRLLERIAQRRSDLPLDCVYAPVGLALGAIGPEEIAVSIAAELVALRRGVEAPHLRAVANPQFARRLAARALVKG